MIDGMKILCGPVQGFTDCHWRNAHQEIFGGPDGYYGPFMRVEHGEIEPGVGKFWRMITSLGLRIDIVNPIGQPVI